MGGRLGPLEATGLYLLVFAACIFFFVAGVLVGRWIPNEPEPVEIATTNTEADPEEDLGFFREIVGAEDRAVVSPPSQQNEPDSSDSSGSEPPAERHSPEAAVDDPPVAPRRSFFTVQVGAMENSRTVNQLVVRLTAKGYPSRVIEPGEQGNQTYLIWVENCETRAEAEDLELRLKEDGFQTYIKQVRGTDRQ